MDHYIHSVLSIPAIQDGITQYLDLIDLICCQRVNRSWRNIFTAPLFQRRRLAICPSTMRYATEEKWDIFHRIGPHIGILRLLSSQSLDTISPYLRGITTFALEEWLNLDEQGAANWQRVVAFLASCPRLESVSVGFNNCTNMKQFFTALSKAVGSRVRKLTIRQKPRAYSLVPFTHVLYVLEKMPAVTSLQFYGIDMLWKIDPEQTIPSNLALQLRSLQLYPGGSQYSTIDTRVYFPVWRLFPNLEHYDMSRIPKHEFESLVSVFAARDTQGSPIHRARSLCLPLGASMQDEQVAQILGGCIPHHLWTLEMNAAVLGPMTFEMLFQTQFGSLEKLTVENRVVEGFLTSPWIQRMLTSCPRLRNLQIFTNNINVREAIHLRTTDIISSPWVCAQLEHLIIPIVDIRYTNSDTATDKEGGRIHGCGDVDMEAVDQVMKQIGRMIRLKEFGSGLSGLHSKTVNRDTLLPFSLGAGGLQHLVGLIHLERIDLAGYEHKIGLEEALWMSMHWRNLKVVYGFGPICSKNKAGKAASWLRKNANVHVTQ